MSICLCSNCEPEGALQLINAFPKTSRFDLDDLIKTPILDQTGQIKSTLPYLWYPPKVVVSTLKPGLCKTDDQIRMDQDYVELAVSLVGHFERLYRQSPLKNSGLLPEIFFTREQA